MSLRRAVLRLSAVLLSGLGVIVATAALTPAYADVPVGWSNPPSVNLVRALLILAGIPLLMALAIIAAVYAPSLARGERVLPGDAPVTDQWLGGASRGRAELSGPDTDTSEAGGARGQW